MSKYMIGFTLKFTAGYGSFADLAIGATRGK
jgi:hypothetical protein